MEDLANKISKLIEDDINPALAMHKGFVDLVEVEETEGQTLVALQFYGACQGCSASMGATKFQIEKYLQEELNRENLRVINVDYE